MKKANDPKVLESVRVYDQILRKETRQGPGYYRYNRDRYNYDESTGAQTDGMLWPLLTGERGSYEYDLQIAQGGSRAQARAAALPYLRAIENFAMDTDMIPEQVWDGGPFAGMPTGSATPLGWAHGEYIFLLDLLQ